MNCRIVPFTDSDGYTFTVSDICAGDLDGVLAIFFTVDMNGQETETFEYLDTFDADNTDVESNLWVNHRRQFGEEAYDFISDCLTSWLSENQQGAA